MKKNNLCLLIIVFVTCFLSSQFAMAQFPVDSASGKIKYSKVVDFPGLSKEKIYKNAKSWMITTLKSSDNMVELDDVNMEKIVATGTLIIDKLRLPYAGTPKYSNYTNVSFKFIVLIKENKLKYSVENFTFIYTFIDNSLIESSLENIKPGSPSWNKNMKKNFNETVFKNVNPAIESMISNFLASIKQDENKW